MHSLKIPIAIDNYPLSKNAKLQKVIAFSRLD
jgi:hypothetical protein